MPEPLAVASWNVNSLRVRLPHLLDWLRRRARRGRPAGDQARGRPVPARRTSRRSATARVRGQKTYNGVALLSRQPLDADVHRASPASTTRSAASSPRPSAASAGQPVRGQRPGRSAARSTTTSCAGSPRCAAWLADELARFPQLVVLGDFNIAPDDRDVHDPPPGHEQVLCSHAGARRAAATARARPRRQLPPAQPPATFSWWDYRAAGVPPQPRPAHRPAAGRAEALRARLCAPPASTVEPRRNERPSDHAPVYGHFAAAAAAPAVS
jgi:exodeoxyribonuclease III